MKMIPQLMLIINTPIEEIISQTRKLNLIKKKKKEKKVRLTGSRFI